MSVPSPTDHTATVRVEIMRKRCGCTGKYHSTEIAGLSIDPAVLKIVSDALTAGDKARAALVGGAAPRKKEGT